MDKIRIEQAESLPESRLLELLGHGEDGAHRQGDAPNGALQAIPLVPGNRQEFERPNANEPAAPSLRSTQSIRANATPLSAGDLPRPGLDRLPRLAGTGTARAPAKTPAASPSPLANVALTSPSLFFSQLVRSAKGILPGETAKTSRYGIRPDGTLEYHSQAQLVPSLVQLKLDGFCQHWQANLLRLDAGCFLIDLSLAGNWWQRCLGLSPGLEITVSFPEPQEFAVELTEVSVAIRPVRCGRAAGVRFVERLGPRLLESLRSYLHMVAERREQQRLACSNPVWVMPLMGEEGPIQAAEGLAVNVSVGGIGFLLASDLPSDRVFIRASQSGRATALAVTAQLVRKRHCGDGVYEIGARFARAGCGLQLA
jgi:hypothetical protein